MELKDTVVLFSTEVFSDVFDSNVTFNAKVNPFSEVANSGTSSQRRILEIAPGQTIPTGRVVADMTGQKFIVAAPNEDYWDNEVIRVKFSILPVSIQGAVGDIGDTIAFAQADTDVYAYPYFVRREIDEDEMSDYLSGYEIYFSPVKSFIRSSIVQIATTYYRLKTDTWTDGAGFTTAQAVKLENPVQLFSVGVKSSVYDVAADGYPAAITEGVRCFVEPLRQDYEFVYPAFEDIQEGDKAISLLKSAVEVKVNDYIGEYRILSIRDQGLWVTCQCRNMGGEYEAPVNVIYLFDETDGADIVEDSDPSILIIDDA